MRIDESNVYRVQRPRGRSPGSQPDVVIVCQCGVTDSIRSKGNTPTECIGERFRHRGWQVDAAGKKAVCKECQMKKKANGSAPTTAAVSSLVAAVRLLDTHFDIDSGSYTDPRSDAAIAAKVGLAEPAITSLRENDYGPLSVDPEVARIEQEVSALDRKLDRDRSDLQELLDAQYDENRKVVAALECRLIAATKGRKPAGAAA